MEVNNRKIRVRDFYRVKPYESECEVCDENPATMQLHDGYDTIICDFCSFKTLGECGFREDFNSNQFNKNQQTNN